MHKGWYKRLLLLKISLSNYRNYCLQFSSIIEVICGSPKIQPFLGIRFRDRHWAGPSGPVILQPGFFEPGDFQPRARFGPNIPARKINFLSQNFFRSSKFCSLSIFQFSYSPKIKKPNWILHWESQKLGKSQIVHPKLHLL